MRILRHIAGIDRLDESGASDAFGELRSMLQGSRTIDPNKYDFAHQNALMEMGWPAYLETVVPYVGAMAKRGAFKSKVDRVARMMSDDLFTIQDLLLFSKFNLRFFKANTFAWEELVNGMLEAIKQGQLKGTSKPVDDFVESMWDEGLLADRAPMGLKGPVARLTNPPDLYIAQMLAGKDLGTNFTDEVIKAWLPTARVRSLPALRKAFFEGIDFEKSFKHGAKRGDRISYPSFKPDATKAQIASNLNAMLR